MSMVRGSVMTPVKAEAVAVSGLHRYTWSSLVPERPGKLRGTVRRLIFPVAGALPHTDAATASGLMNAGAAADQFFQQSQLCQIFQYLP